MMSLLDLLSSNANCSSCGKEKPDSITASGKSIPIKYKSDLCLECDEVSRISSIVSSGDKKYIVFEGYIYFIGKSIKGRPKGYGGKKFQIVFIKSRSFVSTDNLFMRMKIPDDSMYKFQDNAIISPNPQEREHCYNDEEEAEEV